MNRRTVCCIYSVICLCASAALKSKLEEDKYEKRILKEGRTLSEEETITLVEKSSNKKHMIAMCAIAITSALLSSMARGFDREATEILLREKISKENS